MTETISARNIEQNTSQEELARPNRMTIDLANLEHNYRRVRDLVGPDIQILPCLKNDAYGLSAPRIARRLTELGARTIMTGTLEDAMAIRSAVHATTKIVMFGGALPGAIPLYLERNLTPTCHTMEIAVAVSRAASGPTPLFVKIDAGRGRLGFPLKTAEDSILEIAAMPNVLVEGIYTHLPFKTVEDLSSARDRTRLFNDLVDRLAHRGLRVPITQARSSTGIVTGLDDRSNAVCPGRLLLGYPPAITDAGTAAGFRPLITKIRSRLVQISPGGRGAIPIGRREGMHPARGGSPSLVIVNGVVAPILSVSSELSIIDLTAVAGARLGDEVVLVGRSDAIDLELEDAARRQGMSPDEWLLSIRGRIPQMFLG